jgi:hypothetical protein
VLVAETIAGLMGAAQQAGNPYGIERHDFGAAAAFVGRNTPPHGWWNRLLGFQPDHINAIDDIIALYRDGARRCHIDLDPLTLMPEIGEALAARGLAPAPNGTVLYGVSAAHAPPLPTVSKSASLAATKPMPSPNCGPTASRSPATTARRR